MKYLRNVILIVIICESHLFSQNFSRADSIPKFRGFDWAESIDNVKSREFAKYMQTYIGFGVYILSYHGEIADYEARIDFVFEDEILVEGQYIVEVDAYVEIYERIKDFYFRKLGMPNYWASSHPNSKFDWTDTEEDGLCRGPEIYWEYCDGFIGIIVEKYMEEITITILYVHEKTILDYGKLVTFPYEEILE